MAIDALSLRAERWNLQQNRWLAQIPMARGRRGGTHTLTEWAYTIGLFQSVIHHAVGPRESLEILDVGCGTGRLALAAAPLIGLGRYVGVDINAHDIATARDSYEDPRFEFIDLVHRNGMYAPDAPATFEPYPFSSNSFDLVTALSVWTHLNEDDATFYASEIYRVLRPGGKAMITFFILDRDYDDFAQRIPSQSSFSFRTPSRYRFDVSVDGSADWLTPSWTTLPEYAIGVTTAGLARLQTKSGLQLETLHSGYWKERPGLFFQDIAVFRR